MAAWRVTSIGFGFCFLLAISFSGCTAEPETAPASPTGVKASSDTAETSSTSSETGEAPELQELPAADFTSDSLDATNAPSDTSAGDTTQTLAVNTVSSLTKEASPVPAPQATPAPADAIALRPARIRLDEETTISITGRNLAGAKVELKMNKQETNFPAVLEERDSELIIQRTAHDAPLPGRWDVVITLPDGTITELPGGLEVE